MKDVEVETYPGVVLDHRNISMGAVRCYIPGTSSAKTIRVSGQISPRNRPDIRLQPCLMLLHATSCL